MNEYSFVAQKLVYLILVTHKLTKDTKTIFNLIERLPFGEYKEKICNELSIAFTEAAVDIESAIELEDERDVTELHELFAANNDFMRHLMLKTFCNKIDSTQESKDSQHLSNSSTDTIIED